MNRSDSSAGKISKTRGARIAGVVSCVPTKKIENSYFDNRFEANEIQAISKMTGVQSRRWVEEDQTTLDLCMSAGSHLLKNLEWDPDSVDALIFVSQTPDYRLPASACVMQEKLGLSRGVIAFDVNLGCSAYPYALWLASTLIQTGSVKRVLLAVGDTISKVVDPSDRSTAMLFGDAGSVTALESTASDSSEIFFILGTDGKGASNLLIPNGAARYTDGKKDGRLVGRNLSCLYMDGGEIFNFTLKSVPPLVNALLQSAKKSVEEYDAFLFHQANLFMLNHLAKKSKIPSDKVLTNIRDYGNTSCASIPLLMTTLLKESLMNKPLQIALLGFGVGYSWGGASLKTDKLNFVDSIEL